MRLNQSDFRAVSDALRELYAQTDSTALPHCIVRLLHRLIPANSAVYNSFDFRTGDMQVVHDHGPDGDRYLPALNEHIEEHPLLIHMRENWRRGAATIADVITHRQLRDLPIYSEFLRPLSIKRQLGLLVEDKEYGVAAVGLQRDGSDFSARDRTVLTLLQPHIIQACKNASDFTRTITQKDHSDQALRVAQVGVLRLSAQLMIEWQSPQAALWLKAYFPKDVERIAVGELPVAVSEWLQRSMKKRRGDRGKVPAQLQVFGPRGHLSIRPIQMGTKPLDLVLSEERSNQSPRELESLGLTPREAEVLHWISEDKSNDAIGVILSTSRRTVDKQVESVLRKLGVSSRVGAAVMAERHRRKQGCGG